MSGQMTSFAQDRDILVMEPSVFTRAAFVGQRVTRGEATVSGTTLTASSSQPALNASGVPAGAVVLFADAALEVVSVDGPAAMTVSRTRVSGAAEALAPAVDGSAAGFEVVTFGPLLSVVHGELLRRLGVDSAAAVLAPEVFRRLEVLGALALAWGSAAAGLGDTAGEQVRSEQWARRFRAEAAAARVPVDLDGDGVADETRALAVRVVRA